MRGYYPEHLAGTRLQRVYELASPRIREYLEAEASFVIDQVRGASRILELGCGYGRVMRLLAPHVGRIVGNDVARNSLLLGASYLCRFRNADLLAMDAANMAFRDGTFDAVFCVQNGISAFGVDRRRLVSEAARVTRRRGKVLFSSYSSRIWNQRLAWFRDQAAHGLLGEVDEARTGNGTIVCKDGFRATTVGGDEFVRVFAAAALEVSLHEVDGSSLFAVAEKGERARGDP